MSQRRSFDKQRGLSTIHHNPAARNIMSPDEVKQMLTDGTAPNTYDHELDRCPGCGRAEECVCSDCRFCVDGIPRIEHWSPAEQRRWSHREPQQQEMDDS